MLHYLNDRISFYAFVERATIYPVNVDTVLALGTECSYRALFILVDPLERFNG